MRLAKSVRAAAAAIIVAAAATAGAFASAPDGSAGGRQCTTRPLGVSLAPGRPVNQFVVIEHCIPRGRAQPRDVNVFSDGATYTRYWDWPIPRSYSVVDKVIADGKATLTYDRIGTGRSSRLPSTSVTLAVDVWVVEQIMRWLSGRGYAGVSHWVHSYSAAVGIEHAASPGMTAVQELVVTGFLHTSRNPEVATRIYPANKDDRRWREFDDGWLTTKPGTRGLSYHGPNALHSVIQLDERRKDVISATAFQGYAAQQSSPADRNIATNVKVPVTIVIGSQDAIFCRFFDCSDAGAVRALEAPYFKSAPTLKVVVARSGHSLALDPAAATTYDTLTNGTGSYPPAQSIPASCQSARTTTCTGPASTYHDRGSPGAHAESCSSCHLFALTIPARQRWTPTPTA